MQYWKRTEAGAIPDICSTVRVHPPNKQMQLTGYVASLRRPAADLHEVGWTCVRTEQITIGCIR